MYSLTQRVSQIEQEIIRDFIDGQGSSIRGYLHWQMSEGRLTIRVDLLNNRITLEHSADHWATLTGRELAGKYRPCGYDLLVTVRGGVVAL